MVIYSHPLIFPFSDFASLKLCESEEGGIVKDYIHYSNMTGGVSCSPFRATKGSDISRSFTVLMNFFNESHDL